MSTHVRSSIYSPRYCLRGPMILVLTQSLTLAGSQPDALAPFINREAAGRYLCKLCGKQFCSNYHVRRHMSIHTGEKQFQCNICKKRFSQKANLKAHLVLHLNRVPLS